MPNQGGVGIKLQLSELRTERQWRAATGLDQGRFETLLVHYTQGYQNLHGRSVADRQAGLEVTPSLTSEAELLYFTLFSLKSGLTYDLIGIVCGMDTANAKRNQTLGIEVLVQTLQELNCMPKRSFKNAAEFADYLNQEGTLIIDGIEQRTQRPCDNEAQKDNYSGKKRAYSEVAYFDECHKKDLISE